MLPEPPKRPCYTQHKHPKMKRPESPKRSLHCTAYTVPPRQSSSCPQGTDGTRRTRRLPRGRCSGRRDTLDTTKSANPRTSVRVGTEDRTKWKYQERARSDQRRRRHRRRHQLVPTRLHCMRRKMTLHHHCCFGLQGIRSTRTSLARRRSRGSTECMWRRQRHQIPTTPVRRRTACMKMSLDRSMCQDRMGHKSTAMWPPRTKSSSLHRTARNAPSQGRSTPQQRSVGSL